MTDICLNQLCLKIFKIGQNYESELQVRILKKGEVKPSDYDMFVQCYSCGNIFPIYEAHYESEIKDSLETTDNPFENKSIFLTTESRATQRRKREIKDRYKKGVTRHTSKRFETDEYEDPEILAEINKGNTVRIIQDT